MVKRILNECSNFSQKHTGIINGTVMILLLLLISAIMIIYAKTSVRIFGFVCLFSAILAYYFGVNSRSRYHLQLRIIMLIICVVCIFWLMALV